VLSVGGRPTSVHVRSAHILTGYSVFRAKDHPPPPPWRLSNLCDITGYSLTTNPPNVEQWSKMMMEGGDWETLLLD
jgi:hypothetical protein